MCVYMFYENYAMPIVDFYEWILCLPTSDRLALDIPLIVEWGLWCGACIIKINQRRHILIQFIVRVRDFETLFAHNFFFLFYSMKINNFICIIDKIDTNPKSNNTVNLPLNIFIHQYTRWMCVCTTATLIDLSKRFFVAVKHQSIKFSLHALKHDPPHLTMSIKIAHQFPAFESEIENEMKSTLEWIYWQWRFNILIHIARNQMSLLHWTNWRTSLISH